MNNHEIFSNTLIKHLAVQLFDILPEQGPIMIIHSDMERWVSDPASFNQCKIDESFLKDLCSKVDDGAEPVIAQIKDCSVVAAQLSTDNSKLGYLILVQPQSGPESALANIDLIEIVLGQANLIAGLIEKNNRLFELQSKRLHRDLTSVLN